MVKIFVEHSPELEQINNVGHDIVLTNNTPVASKPYGVPLKIQNALRKKIKELLNTKIIRMVYSLFSLTCFTILKLNNDIRLVIDFRQVNSDPKTMAYPNLHYLTNYYLYRGVKYFLI